MTQRAVRCEAVAKLVEGLAVGSTGSPAALSTDAVAWSDRGGGELVAVKFGDG